MTPDRAAKWSCLRPGLLPILFYNLNVSTPSEQCLNQERSNALLTDRERARFALRNDDMALAERYFARVLSVEPDDAEASQFMANCLLDRRQTSQAIVLLTAACNAHPENPAVRCQLGAAQMLAGDFQNAVDNLYLGVKAAPELFVERLRLGAVLEELGRTHEALAVYFGAINAAQAQGRWVSNATTRPDMADAVKHAIRYVDAGRHQLFDAVIEPLRVRHGRSALARVEHCLAIYLGEQPANLPDPRQRPRFLYFPDIPSQTYYPSDRFSWLVDLEAATDVIREELGAILASPQALVPFQGINSTDGTNSYLGSLGQSEAAWDALFFYRHGTRHDANCARCPQSVALLDAMPLVRIHDHAPEILFSVLRPATHILPHRGVTNTRLVTHLPLMVPADCALRVGGDIHAWEEGRCVTFDDTFEHEAWNRSDQTRVVLILDNWNPDLTEIERTAVTDLVIAIGHFNRASEIPAPHASIAS